MPFSTSQPPLPAPLTSLTPYEIIEFFNYVGIKDAACFNIVLRVISYMWLIHGLETPF